MLTRPPTSCPKSKIRRDPFPARCAGPGYLARKLVSISRIDLGETRRENGEWMLSSHGPGKEASGGPLQVAFPQHASAGKLKSKRDTNARRRLGELNETAILCNGVYKAMADKVP